MSNKEETITNDKKILTRQNEEETTTLEIDEISDLFVNITNAQMNVTENYECKNDDFNNNLIQNLDVELENVIVKSNELEQKCAIFELVEKDQKRSSIWVQYNQIIQFKYKPLVYGKRTSHKRVDGDYGGAPLSYEPGSRNEFVRIVFIILFVMLSITAIYGIIVLNSGPLKKFYKRAGLFLIILSTVVLIAMNYVMACLACARVPPCNFICLGIVVIAMTNLVAAVTVQYRTEILVLAVISTMITVFFCILLACSNFDFTAWYIYVVVVVMVFMAISMVASFTMLAMGMKFKILQIVLLFIGTLLQVIILIMELQMILGGRSIELGEEDYALAAYMLYTSIVDIFLQMVQLMGLTND